jgi:hypothetical protein
MTKKMEAPTLTQRADVVKQLLHHNGRTSSLCHLQCLCSVTTTARGEPVMRSCSDKVTCEIPHLIKVTWPAPVLHHLQRQWCCSDSASTTRAARSLVKHSARTSASRLKIATAATAAAAAAAAVSKCCRP